MRKARESAGIGAAEMADRLNVGRNTISNWEHDRTSPNPDAIAGYVRHCRVPWWWLMGIEPDGTETVQGQPDTLSSTNWYTENPCSQRVTLAAA